ncbi:hypothetical protein F5148DRAFT_995619 [Russula earlei]|uniref:Uncharacterized protein n=1 Tax=Russula earlei TaxID=71964 RepID=A0ACC0UFV0_9AGAM|nr:hypothetical protein F5148DRAFT_995619 [Russula earlei]
MASIIKLNANEHPIKSVTVFKSNKAEVVRIFKVSLKEGQSKIQIRRLSSSIDTESARVTGLGDAQLFDVVCSIGTGFEEIDTASTAEAVRKLKSKKDVLVKDLDTINDVSETMMNYAKSLSGDSVPPRQAERFFESLLSRSNATATVRAELEEGILQLSRQIEVLSSAEPQKQGNAGGEVTVVIMAKQATDIELRLTYLVRNATWAAAYELHATTESGVPAPSVSLHYRARIAQCTGEDWANVKLTLSTGDMNLSNQTIPVLSPTKIRPPRSLFFGGGGHPQQLHRKANAFGQANVVPVSTFGQPNVFPQATGFAGYVPPPAPQQAQQFMQVQQQSAAFGGPPVPGGAFGSAPQPPPPPPPPGTMPIQRRERVSVPVDEWQIDDFNAEEDTAEEATTTIGEPTSVVHESPLALTYHVEGASGVPSDGVPHQVSIAVLPFDAKIQHVTVPKVRPVAYLQATVKNTSDYRLLPGAVHAFVDDSFVSKTSIDGDVAPGDLFSCTLGADPATRIRYSRTAKRADDDGDDGDGHHGGAARSRSAFSEQWATTTYRSRTTVTNRHPFALRALVLRDGVPVSDDEKRVSVVLRRPVGLAELEQGKELKVGREDGKGEGEGEGESEGEGEKRTVRWSKAVDGKGGKKIGLFEWVFEVGAGEEVTIETEWDVKAPVSLKWIESA